MMIELIHITKYKYSKPVFLEPHVFRLTPIQNIFVKLVEHNIKVEPEPITMYYGKCTDGSCYYAAFTGLTDNLKVIHKACIKFDEYNPFSFVIYPDIFNNIPFDIEAKELKELQNFIITDSCSKNIKALALEISKSSNNNVIEFLNFLNSFLNKNIKYAKRSEGSTNKGEITLREGKGSCRDISQLFIEVCRSLNIPARFISGYYIPTDLKEDNVELHAWVEVYIPGAGWIGYDPTHGILCYGRHIALSTSAISCNTLPVSGFFRGSAKSEISYEIECKEIL